VVKQPDGSLTAGALDVSKLYGGSTDSSLSLHRQLRQRASRRWAWGTPKKPSGSYAFEWRSSNCARRRAS